LGAFNISQGKKELFKNINTGTNEMKREKVNVKKACLVPLLEPSSPRITLMAEITCWTAGGDMEVAYRWAGQLCFRC
jgi:hypothetical protein